MYRGTGTRADTRRRAEEGGQERELNGPVRQWRRKPVEIAHVRTVKWMPIERPSHMTPSDPSTPLPPQDEFYDDDYEDGDEDDDEEGDERDAAGVSGDVTLASSVKAPSEETCKMEVDSVPAISPESTFKPDSVPEKEGGEEQGPQQIGATFDKNRDLDVENEVVRRPVSGTTPSKSVKFAEALPVIAELSPAKVSGEPPKQEEDTQGGPM
mmetsp:Transcript_16071/g.32377  ORF Transcript_16071/g.32377 Transcript_16071/m.32377 type:complete len:211 (-) Transcript_16071:1513-2145(-)